MSPRTGTVVVPAFNEAEVVADSLVRIAAVLVSALGHMEWEVLVVDDGSVDGTAEVAASAAVALTRPGLVFRVLRHLANHGLGAALRTGFAASTGDVVVVLDCDLSYHPDHVPRLVEALGDGAHHVAIASPYMPGGEAIAVPPGVARRSRVANRFLAAASNSHIHTSTGMVRAYDGRFLRSLSLKGTDQRINVEILYKTQIMRGEIVEIPAVLDWRGLQRRADRSPTRERRIRRTAYRTILDGVLFRPYLLFLAVGSMLTVLGAALLLLGALLGSLSAALLGASLLGTGVLMGSAALLSIQVKRAFEELYFQQAGSGAHNHSDERFITSTAPTPVVRRSAV